MAKIPGDIQKWNKRWGTDVKYCFPSGGGAVGVVFVYTTVSNWVGASGSVGAYAPKDAAFVIKPIQGSAAPTKFAETLLSKIAGAKSPDSVPISRKTIYGASLVAMLKKFMTAETDPATKQRWQQVYANYDQADNFLIQETQKAIVEFGDQYREAGGLTAFLSDREIMINLGKLFAADALIGNGDRLYQVNAGNILYDPRTRQFSAIDSTTILTNFNAILNDTTKLSDSAFRNDDTTRITPQHWASQDIVRRAQGGAIPSPAQQNAYLNDPTLTLPLAPTMPVKPLFNVKEWFSGFKFHLSKAPDKPSDNIWFQAELWFTEGVNQGIHQIDSRLSGFNWLLMKNKYKSYVSKYGGDPNLDWMNFKIRRKYIKLRKSGMPEDQVLTVIQDYVKRKMPGL